MRTQFKVLAFFVLLTMPSLLEARLGETKDQCIKRYGGVWSENPIGKSGVELNMPAEQLANPRIVAVIYNNICHKITFSSSKLNYFTPKIVEDLLEKNADGNTWSKSESDATSQTNGNKWLQPTEESSDTSRWKRSDGGKASLNWTGTLEIESGSYQELSKQAEKNRIQAIEDSEKEKLDNF